MPEVGVVIGGGVAVCTATLGQRVVGRGVAVLGVGGRALILQACALLRRATGEPGGAPPRW